VSFTTPASVPSGIPRRVTDVESRSPADLTDFVGDVGFHLEDDYLVRGTGRLAGDQVRFHEKDVAANGKDVRVWSIRRDNEAFLAEPAPTF
jgi:hypothetical protein